MRQLSAWADAEAGLNCASPARIAAGFKGSDIRSASELGTDELLQCTDLD